MDQLSRGVAYILVFLVTIFLDVEDTHTFTFINIGTFVWLRKKHNNRNIKFYTYVARTLSNKNYRRI